MARVTDFCARIAFVAGYLSRKIPYAWDLSETQTRALDHEKIRSALKEHFVDADVEFVREACPETGEPETTVIVRESPSVERFHLANEVVDRAVGEFRSDVTVILLSPEDKD